MQFKDAFKREATLQQNKFSPSLMHWRHVDNGHDVVSPDLDWDNVTHPEDHDDFTSDSMGELNGVPRYSPKEPANWDTFRREVDKGARILDTESYRQFESAFADTDYLNAETVIEFLSGTFTSHIEYDEPKTSDCSTCYGTGRQCQEESCDTEPCSVHEHWGDCQDCDGEGGSVREEFSRRFPRERAAILSEEPSQKERQVFQFALSRLGNLAADRETTVAFRKVLTLFSMYETEDMGAVIDQVIEYVADSLETIEVPKQSSDGSVVTDEDGNTVTVEQPDPEAVEQARQKLHSRVSDAPSA